jgi:opacity protein-like surface antigen
MDAPTQYASVALTMSPVKSIHANIGYRISDVSGNQFFNDARAVNGSLDSKYQSPFVNVAWTIHPGWIWKAEYNYYGYGEGGPSGPQYCSTSTSATSAVVPCTSLPEPTGLTEPSSGLTSPRNFHANNVTIGMHYEF